MSESVTVTGRRPGDDPGAQVDLSTVLAGVHFPNPVFTASGCAAAGAELAQFFPLSEIGAVTTKSIMLEPRAGRPTPRMAETASGMLNSIGLQGPGVDGFLLRELPRLVEYGGRAIVSIAGTTEDDYASLAGRLRGAPLSMLEVNISCPNVAKRGEVFACDPEAAAAVVSAVRRNSTTGVPVFVKLSPDVTDIVAIAQACVAAGADGLSLINTLLGMVVDTWRMAPVLAGTTGGLSGPAIRPVALRCVWQVHEALPDVPIIGMGGIGTGEQALEFLLAGASAVSIGTMIFHDPSAPVRIVAELRRALAARGIERVSDVVGGAHRPPAPVVPEKADPPAEDAPEAQSLDFEEAG